MIPRRLTNRPVLRGKQSKADSQRHKVYSMERCYVGWAVGTKTSMEVICSVRNHACREWGVPIPAIEQETRQGTYGSCTETAIHLNIDHDGQNLATFLHELAHWIQWHKCPDTEDHGGTFVGIYRYLLDRYNMLPAYAFDAMCKEWDVKVCKVNP